MKTLYLILTVLGAFIPYVFFVQHFSTEGFGLVGFVAALFVTSAASGFTADLLITSFVFWLFMWQRQRRGEGPSAWIFILLNLLIGLSCAFPAYLYVRERHESNA